MKSYEIPLTNLSKERLEEPNLGASYYRGIVKTYPEDQSNNSQSFTAQEQEFKIWVHPEEQWEKFIYCMKACLKNYRQYPLVAEDNIKSEVTSKIFKQNFQKMKKDPSTLFQTQPPATAKPVKQLTPRMIQNNSP